VVWVNQAYVETRKPALAYRFARHTCGDSPIHAALVVRALRAFFELRRLLSRESFDLLHAHTRGMLLVALMAARWLRRDIVFTNHNFARRVGFYRWASHQCRIQTVVLTPNMARHYHLPEAQPHLSVISACCADDFFALPVARDLAATRGGRLRLVGVGNIVRWKNWHLVLEALRLLSPAERQRIEFTHWGPTPADRDSARYDHELRRSVADGRLERQFIFGGPSNSIRDCLLQADWFVLPSTNEPCSVALIEALASGMPALVSASGGNVDIVLDGRTGLLFEPDSAADLAAKMQMILTAAVNTVSPDQIRETVRSRSATEVALKYEKLYRHLCANGRAEPR
jgi:glycosyltransferase involved in cell wall biosynthesis